VSQGAGHPIQLPQCRYKNIFPSNTAHWVRAWGHRSTESTHYHPFCPFDSSSSHFDSSRNYLENLKSKLYASSGQIGLHTLCSFITYKPCPDALLYQGGDISTQREQLSLFQPSSWISDVKPAPPQPVVRMRLTIPRDGHRQHSAPCCPMSDSSQSPRC